MAKGIQFKSFKADAFDYENGTVEGYASTFGNIDKVQDVVTPGAFKTALLNGPDRVRFLWEHDRKEVIGVIESLEEDTKGLRFRARFAGTQRAQETRELMKMGAVDSFSIGYRVLQEQKGSHKGKSVNFLKEIQLLEVSCVAWPCNVEARMSAIKSELDERFDGLTLDQQALIENFIGFLEAETEQKSDEADKPFIERTDAAVHIDLTAIKTEQEWLFVEDAEQLKSEEDAAEAPESVTEDTAELEAVAEALALFNLAQALKSAL
ncbi:HK97 family phage prohead protease [Sphingomonas sp. Leaf28]|uniref:HK97 family phage prohead protease n=1 Tax=Sphingomonas sp. Leaf28 TaxID=1735695 RepID=UPI0006F94F4F|nr:HK97 family phage prohead protease [Sphingomonas sp. Leaf28]KQN09079.1 hypothetical protein ASE79_14600 [Sphingomonas sp. Leaf28]